MANASEKIRVDKWLWHARFFKTRSLAAALVDKGAVRLNGEIIRKRATTVGPDDVLTFAQGDRIRVVRIHAIGQRRGPAPEAQALYEDLSPVPPAPDKKQEATNPAYDGKGRPTKRDRRALDNSRTQHLE